MRTLNEIYNELKEMDLNILMESIDQEDISQEEMEFRIMLYNHFLQRKQKEVINSEFKM